MSLDGASFAVTYTSISSKAWSWSISTEDPYEEAAQQALEQASPIPSLAYVLDPMELEDLVPVYVPDPDYPEYLASSNDDIPVEDQPLPADASPAALSRGYIAYSDPEEDEEDLEEDLANYPGDGGDDDDELSDDDDDDNKDVKEDKNEEEEHLVLADSTAVASPVVDLVPSAEETESFETDESAATPPPPPAYRTTSRMSVQT
ncbi:hypothetical protein Tco_1129333 [Tanacetum coccineum]